MQNMRLQTKPGTEPALATSSLKQMTKQVTRMGWGSENWGTMIWSDVPAVEPPLLGEGEEVCRHDRNERGHPLWAFREGEDAC